MTRWKSKFNKYQVIELFHRLRKEKDRFTSVEMADELGCEPSYIRATLGRAGLTLPRSPKKSPSLSGTNQYLRRKIVAKKIRKKRLTKRKRMA